MRKIKIFLVCSFLFVLVGCGGSESEKDTTSNDKEEEKEELTTGDIIQTALDKSMGASEFDEHIKLEWTPPNLGTDYHLDESTIKVTDYSIDDCSIVGTRLERSSSDNEDSTGEIKKELGNDTIFYMSVFGKNEPYETTDSYFHGSLFRSELIDEVFISPQLEKKSSGGDYSYFEEYNVDESTDDNGVTTYHMTGKEYSKSYGGKREYESNYDCTIKIDSNGYMTYFLYNLKSPVFSNDDEDTGIIADYNWEYTYSNFK